MREKQYLPFWRTRSCPTCGSPAGVRCRRINAKKHRGEREGEEMRISHWARCGRN